MKKKSAILPITALFFLTIFSACNKKEGCTDPAALNFDPEAEVDKDCLYDESFAVEMHMHQYMGVEEIESGSTYNINGVQTKLDLAQFYISNIRLVDAAGNETAAEGVYLLIKPEVEEYEIGDFPAGDYTSVRFDVGIDSITNHGDPSQYAIGEPLGSQFPNMHWGWSFGYIFVRVDGQADIDGDDIPDNPDGVFEMHLGTEPYLASVQIDLPVPLTIGEGDENIAHLATHWDMFFTGVNTATDNTTHTTDNVSLANIIYDNILTMFGPED